MIESLFMVRVNHTHIPRGRSPRALSPPGGRFTGRCAPGSRCRSSSGLSVREVLTFVLAARRWGSDDLHNRLAWSRREGEEGRESEGKRHRRPFRPRIPLTTSRSKASQVTLAAFWPGPLARRQPGAVLPSHPPLSRPGSGLEQSRTHRSHLQRRGRAGIALASLRPERLFQEH
jgi:hypothetical protein